MARSLFMASENHINILLLMKHVENLQNDTTRKRKYRLDAFPFEAFDEDLSTCELHNRTSVLATSETLAEESRVCDKSRLVTIDQTRLPRSLRTF